MTTGKNGTLTFRIEPALKEALRAPAAQEHPQHRHLSKPGHL